MKLAEEGKIDISAPVAKYIPEFSANGKQNVTVFELLTHQGGLIPRQQHQGLPSTARKKRCGVSTT